ncbi:MAG: DUF177 domain-containing protein [Candidatus Pacebacteria bacterium]|jgi:uncharacterized protein|nr:DUF177 domain-containing protein [Candidatus Paceibacterota bacterium]
MKVYADQIPPEGVTLEEATDPSVFELDTEIVKFKSPLRIKADIFKITNAVTVDVALHTFTTLTCSRCLKEFDVDFAKDLKLNYQVEKTDRIIDLTPDIRQEILLDYPIKPLCKPDCRGLCLCCGKNLNEAECGCKRDGQTNT